ncbi:MAG: flavin reductase family protein [Actinomycetota bacterium]|nr:flavin reductase family protein [Actinomycetota bacterium]
MSSPSDRVDIRVADAAHGTIYPWLTASLIPRPIAWVSTLSADGIPNLAPHSFTTVAGIDPPTLCFVSIGHKDTLANVRATGEFVLNIGNAATLLAMNDSATNFPAHINEFDAAGLAAAPSAVVAPPRVARAPISFECRVTGEHEIGESVMVFGEVLHISAARSVLAADGLPDALAVSPLARLGRAEWSTLGEVISLDRIRYDDWVSGQRSG